MWYASLCCILWIVLISNDLFLGQNEYENAFSLFYNNDESL